MDVFTQRLEQEFDAAVIITSPNVPYKGFTGLFRLFSILSVVRSIPTSCPTFADCNIKTAVHLET